MFAGSPAVAVPYLRALHSGGVEIAAVITRTDSPVGRKRVLTQTPVAAEAEALGLPVIKANSLRDVEIPEVDLGVVVAYGGLVPPRLLERPTHGWINVHFSVLPAYRGAAPLQRAMWDGQSAAGITIFRLVEELDAGPVLFVRDIPFVPTENASDALARIADETTDELVATVRLIESHALNDRVQEGTPTFAPKLTRADGRIDWSFDAEVIAQRIRAVTREPGAFTTLNGETFGITSVAVTGEATTRPPGTVEVNANGVFVAAGDSLISLGEVTPPGKHSMSATDWARGLRTDVTFE